LPGTVLPLHVFEPRYRAMVEDTLSADRVFGMIQPFAPQQDNRPMPGAENQNRTLYKVGCAGYIEKWENYRRSVLRRAKGVNRFRFEGTFAARAVIGAS
jgi:Lon protease-like protein